MSKNKPRRRHRYPSKPGRHEAETWEEDYSNPVLPLGLYYQQQLVDLGEVISRNLRSQFIVENVISSSQLDSVNIYQRALIAMGEEIDHAEVDDLSKTGALHQLLNLGHGLSMLFSTGIVNFTQSTATADGICEYVGFYNSLDSAGIGRNRIKLKVLERSATASITPTTNFFYCVSMDNTRGSANEEHLNDPPINCDLTVSEKSSNPALTIAFWAGLGIRSDVESSRKSPLGRVIEAIQTPTHPNLSKDHTLLLRYTDPTIPQLTLQDTAQIGNTLHEVTARKTLFG